MAYRADRGVQLDENGRVTEWENQAMTFKIKAEDVPKTFVYEVLERAEKSRIDIEFGKQHPAEDEICDFLNAAIEAGLVSPPCWEVVGETFNAVTVFKRQEDAARWVEDDNGFRKSEMRHWKGQTE